MGVVCAFPFWGGFADGEGKGKKMMKNKGRFWRAKASLFGRESVAAFLVGDLGCALQGSQTAPIFHWLQPAPPSTPFRFETRVCPACCRFPRAVVQSCKVVLSVSRHPQNRYWLLVTRHFSWDCHDWQPLEAFPCSLFPRHIGCISFLLVWSHAERTGTCRRGANLNNCGQRPKKARLT